MSEPNPECAYRIESYFQSYTSREVVSLGESLLGVAGGWVLTLGLGVATSGCCEHAVSSRVSPILLRSCFPRSGFSLFSFAHPLQPWGPSAVMPLAGLGHALCPRLLIVPLNQVLTFLGAGAQPPPLNPRSPGGSDTNRPLVHEWTGIGVPPGHRHAQACWQCQFIG